MPVARRPGGAHTGRAVAVAALGVIVALGAAFLVANLASSGDVEVNIGDDRFEVGDVGNLAETVADGGPVLFQDPATFQRPIYVDHQGDDPEQGWVAFGAFVPNQPRCSVLYLPDDGYYIVQDTDDCDGSMTYPRTGEGLREFDTEVIDGELFVDLRAG